MTTLRTYNDIFKNPWNYGESGLDQGDPDGHWHYLREPRLEEITIWEEIFYQPGNFGIYGAWNPYAEFYIIVYDLYISNTSTVETFYGVNASKNLKERASKLGIDLPMFNVWVDKHNTWLAPPQ
jgi:hypothetical protein